jgi:hypothetical protein
MNFFQSIIQRIKRFFGRGPGSPVEPTGPNDQTYGWARPIRIESHVWGFKPNMVATDDSSKVNSKFQSPTLEIRFKDRMGNIKSEYNYIFASNEDMLEIFDYLAQAESPGKIVWAYLIRGGANYQKVPVSYF